jgi:hypothetical protein
MRWAALGGVAAHDAEKPAVSIAMRTVRLRIVASFSRRKEQ